MPKHEQKHCPRCHSLFECKTGSIQQCQCQQVELNDHQREYIHARFDDCLCATCLEAMRQECNISRFESRIRALLPR